jgi:hypothetical protein
MQVSQDSWSCFTVLFLLKFPFCRLRLAEIRWRYSISPLHGWEDVKVRVWREGYCWVLLAQPVSILRLPTWRARSFYLRFEIFTAGTMKNGIFWDFTSVLTRATRRNIPEDAILQVIVFITPGTRQNCSTPRHWLCLINLHVILYLYSYVYTVYMAVFSKSIIVKVDYALSKVSPATMPVVIILK